jgi:uncharacterized protein (TIGR02466 family)
MFEKQTLELFPTKIVRIFDQNYETYKGELIEQILKIKSKNKVINVSNVGGWHSEYYTPSFNKNLFSYENKLYEMITESVYSLGFEVDFHVKCLWFNVNQPGTYNLTHVHPQSNLSGVFYVKVPQNSGFLYFENQQNRMNPLKNESSTCVIEPFEGEVIVFNSSVPHGVYQNTSVYDRISISFNINLLS